MAAGSVAGAPAMEQQGQSHEAEQQGSRECADFQSPRLADGEDDTEVAHEMDFMLRCCLGVFFCMVLIVAAAASAYFFYSPLLLRFGPYLAPFSHKIKLELRRVVEIAAHAKAVEAARPGARLIIKAAAQRARLAVEAEGMQWSEHWNSFL
jgi:hypothetical protein